MSIEHDVQPPPARKVALVTGGTSGVGKSLLPYLCESGFDVYFIGTSRAKGEAVEAALRTKLDGAQCTFIQLDLSNLADVYAFAQSFRTQEPKLDLLLNVAGLALPNRVVTDEGLETTFAVNYLAAFILGNELSSALVAAAPSRIINVAGGASIVLKDRLNFDDLQMEEKYKGLDAAFNAVHAKTVLTQILSEKLRDARVDVNSFHPGTVKGELTRNQPLPIKLLAKILYLFSAETSQSGVYVSTAKELEGITGQLFVKQDYQPIQFSEGYKQRLWDETEKLLKPILPSN